MRSLHKLAVVVFGSALALLGFYILLSGGVSLPTRQPPRQFHFSGVSLLLLGLSPLLSGVVSLSIAQGSVRRQSRAAHLIVGLSMASLGLAFMLAVKAP